MGVQHVCTMNRTHSINDNLLTRYTELMCILSYVIGSGISCTKIAMFCHAITHTGFANKTKIIPHVQKPVENLVKLTE